VHAANWLALQQQAAYAGTTRTRLAARLQAAVVVAFPPPATDAALSAAYPPPALRPPHRSYAVVAPAPS
jgi:hypothetical protein